MFLSNGAFLFCNLTCSQYSYRTCIVCDLYGSRVFDGCFTLILCKCKFFSKKESYWLVDEIGTPDQFGL